MDIDVLAKGDAENDKILKKKCVFQVAGALQFIATYAIFEYNVILPAGNSNRFV